MWIDSNSVRRLDTQVMRFAISVNLASWTFATAINNFFFVVSFFLHTIAQSHEIATPPKPGATPAESLPLTIYASSS
jgi:hypothetical protein